MFIARIAVGLAVPYVGAWFPELLAHRLAVSVVADVVSIASLFVLGGSFWGKLHGPFVREVAPG